MERHITLKAIQIGILGDAHVGKTCIFNAISGHGRKNESSDPDVLSLSGRPVRTSCPEAF